MKRFSEFSLASGLDGLESRLTLSGFSLCLIAPADASPIDDTGVVGEDDDEPIGDPDVPDPDPDDPDYPTPPPEGDPGPFPGSPPPPIFPLPPIGGPIGPG